MLLSVIEILVMLLVPALFIRLTKIVPLFRRIGVITLCYAFGFLISLSPIPYDRGLSETVASVLVALAIPLILFSFDILKVRHLAKKTIISFLLVILSVIIVSFTAAFIGCSAGLDKTPALSGMAVGLYIGGTPNLFAIGKALLGNDTAVINLANIADSVIGGVYFLLLISVLKNVYTRLLGRKDEKLSVAEPDTEYNAENEYNYRLLPRDRKGVRQLILVILLASAVLGLGVLLEVLISGDLSGSLYIMVTVSVLGILLSFLRPVREVRGTYQVGQYLILVFSLGLSMSIDLRKLIGGILPTLLYFSGIQIFSLLLHFLLCKLFHIDGGTAIITGTAGIYGPPFVAPVANAYGDRSLIVPGVICGTLGLIFGNLIGIGAGVVLSAFIG